MARCRACAAGNGDPFFRSLMVVRSGPSLSADRQAPLWCVQRRRVCLWTAHVGRTAVMNSNAGAAGARGRAQARRIAGLFEVTA
jgi:hypothetical protein